MRSTFDFFIWFTKVSAEATQGLNPFTIFNLLQKVFDKIELSDAERQAFFKTIGDAAGEFVSRHRPDAPAKSDSGRSDLTPDAILQKTQSEIESILNDEMDHYERYRSKDGYSGRRGIVANNLLFQGRTYGEPTKEPSDKLHRVYLMVEIEDIPRMVRILKEMGRERASKGGGLDFKFLVGARDPEAVTFKRLDFSAVEEDDPRVVIYLDTAQEQKAFIEQLLAHPIWYKEMLEMSQKRVNTNGTFKARRPASNVVIDDRTGQELRAICYTEGGTSEGAEAKYGPNWRAHVVGTPTGRLP